MTPLHGKAFAGNRSTTLWAFILVQPNGDEGIAQVAAANPGGVKVDLPGVPSDYPIATRALVASNESMMETMRPIAAGLAQAIRAQGLGDVVLRRYELAEDMGAA